MSSALAHPEIAPLSSSSKAELEGFNRGFQRYTEEFKSWQSLVKEGTIESCHFSGLPTPPETRAMTGISLNQYRPNDVVSQSYYPSTFTNPGNLLASTRASEVRRDQHTGDSYKHNTSTTTVQQQFWPASREKDNGHARKDSSNSDSAIASYLQIPSSVNDSKGSLAEFAADITCLFWFESASTLHRAEESLSLNAVVKPLAPDAFPTVGFLKWVTTILSTTQVTQNVILLALLFIYRLKNFNPGVSGKKGSEYRLLTIALMLGNKFLDDNTYTNKTWAEVSGISVSEIHIMEVEFLSNMRYNLYVSKEEWKRWQVKLARFSTYVKRASKAPLIEAAKPVLPVTPITQSLPYKLPSPPSPARHGPPLPMYQPSLPNPMTVAPYLSHSPARHYEPDHSLGSRKRSLDISGNMPAAKRFMSNTPSGQSPAVHSPESLGPYASSSSTSTSTLADIANNISPVLKLPMPNVSSSSVQMPRQHTSLTPLSVPSVRAMSLVYPHAPNNWSQSVTPVGTMPPASMNLYPNPLPALGELPRSQYASANASPSTAGYGTSTPSRQLSPSYFLTNRNSPYRPVRSVNTLLIPPPSASLHNPTRNIGLDQMRYHPLAKAPTETKAGVVPYMHQDAWPHPWTTAPDMPSQYAFHT